MDIHLSISLLDIILVFFHNVFVIKFLTLFLVLLFVVISGELWFYSLLNQKQKTFQKNIIVQEIAKKPTIQPIIDPFKQKPWQLTDVQSFSDKTNQIEAAIVIVEKNNPSSSEFSVRLKNGQINSIQINPSTKFYSRTILKRGFSKTEQEITPFPIIDKMLLLLTWKQKKSTDQQIIPLTITQQL